MENNIEFVSDTNLGTLEVGSDSELSIKAKTSNKQIKIEYDLISGELPPGLSLAIDGTIIGKILYNSQTYLDFTNFVEGTFAIDTNQTTIDRNFHFTVKARDIYNQSFIEKEFYIKVVENSFTKYTKIYAAPLLPKDQRQIFSDLIDNKEIFDPAMIYRPLDPSFGVQRTMKLIIEYGLEQIHLNDFYDAMRDYFYNKTFYFGDVKVAKANDENKNYVYDLVYVDIIDPYKLNQKQGLVGSVESAGITVFPNSSITWRNLLESIRLEGNEIKVDTHLTPRFMRTSQDETGALFASLDEVVDREKLIGFILPGLAYLDFPLSHDDERKFIRSSWCYCINPEDVELCFRDDFTVAKELVRADKRDLRMYPFPSRDCAEQYFNGYYQEVEEPLPFTEDDFKRIRWNIHSIMGSKYLDKIEEAQRFYQKRHWDYIRRFGTLSAERHAIRAEFESTPETTISALTERWKDCCHKDGLCSCPETSDYLEMLKLYDE